MATIKEIAERAGVSTTTVSNVIHGKTKKVSPANVENIQRLIKEMGYVQKMGLRVLNHEKSQLIAVVVNSHKDYEEAILSDPFYGKILGLIEEQLRALNYYMLFYAGKDIDDIFQMVMGWNVDGVIAVTFTRTDCEKLHAMIHKPVVAIDAYGDYKGQKVVPNVGLDDRGGGYVMTKHLIRQEYENIFVCASRDHGVDHQRWLGACQAKDEDTRAKVKLQFVTLGQSKESREQQYSQLARQIPFKKKTVAFFLSDLFALEAISFFADCGIQIPVDLGVAGYDDIMYANFAVPRLTTVRQDMRQKAERAVELLMLLLQGKEVEKDTSFAVSLIVRKSV